MNARSLPRTELHASRADALRLSERGRLRVRVRGRCHGVVWCEGALRFAWGELAYAFELRAREATVSVWALGLLGVRRVRVRLQPATELSEPRVQAQPPRAGRVHVRMPALCRDVPRARAPRMAVLDVLARTARARVRPPRVRAHPPSLALRTPALRLRLPHPGEPR